MSRARNRDGQRRQMAVVRLIPLVLLVDTSRGFVPPGLRSFRAPIPLRGTEAPIENRDGFGATPTDSSGVSSDYLSAIGQVEQIAPRSKPRVAQGTGHLDTIDANPPPEHWHDASGSTPRGTYNRESIGQEQKVGVKTAEPATWWDAPESTPRGQYTRDANHFGAPPAQKNGPSSTGYVDNMSNNRPSSGWWDAPGRSIYSQQAPRQANEVASSGGPAKNEAGTTTTSGPGATHMGTPQPPAGSTSGLGGGAKQEPKAPTQADWSKAATPPPVADNVATTSTFPNETSTTAAYAEYKSGLGDDAAKKETTETSTAAEYKSVLGGGEAKKETTATETKLTSSVAPAPAKSPVASKSSVASPPASNNMPSDYLSAIGGEQKETQKTTSGPSGSGGHLDNMASQNLPFYATHGAQEKKAPASETPVKASTTPAPGASVPSSHSPASAATPAKAAAPAPVTGSSAASWRTTTPSAPPQAQAATRTTSPPPAPPLVKAETQVSTPPPVSPQVSASDPVKAPASTPPPASAATGVNSPVRPAGHTKGSDANMETNKARGDDGFGSFIREMLTPPKAKKEKSVTNQILDSLSQIFATNDLSNNKGKWPAPKSSATFDDSKNIDIDAVTKEAELALEAAKKAVIEAEGREAAARKAMEDHLKGNVAATVPKPDSSKSQVSPKSDAIRPVTVPKTTTRTTPTSTESASGGVDRQWALDGGTRRPPRGPAGTGSYLENMGTGATTPDWSKAKVPVENKSASSTTVPDWSNAKATNTTPSTPVEKTGASGTAPDWSNAKATTTPSSPKSDPAASSTQSPAPIKAENPPRTTAYVKTDPVASSTPTTVTNASTSTGTSTTTANPSVGADYLSAIGSGTVNNNQASKVQPTKPSTGLEAYLEGMGASTNAPDTSNVGMTTTPVKRATETASKPDSVPPAISTQAQDAPASVASSSAPEAPSKPDTAPVVPNQAQQVTAPEASTSPPVEQSPQNTVPKSPVPIITPKAVASTIPEASTSPHVKESSQDTVPKSPVPIITPKAVAATAPETSTSPPVKESSQATLPKSPVPIITPKAVATVIPDVREKAPPQEKTKTIITPKKPPVLEEPPKPAPQKKKRWKPLINTSDLRDANMLKKKEKPIEKKLNTAPKDFLVQGGSLQTWSFHSSVDRVQVLLKTEGRPLNANLEVWQGPDNTPQMMGVYTEDGKLRPFSAVVETPRFSNSIAIRNKGNMEFPVSGTVQTEVGNTADNGPTCLAAAMKNLSQMTLPRLLQGGALKTFPLEQAVSSVQVLIQTNGLPLNARLELLQGPNNVKQVIDIYSEDGIGRPFYAVIETPGIDNVLSLLNTGPMEFPLIAHMEPCYDEVYSEEYFEEEIEIVDISGNSRTNGVDINSLPNGVTVSNGVNVRSLPDGGTVSNGARRIETEMPEMPLPYVETEPVRMPINLENNGAPNFDSQIW